VPDVKLLKRLTGKSAPESIAEATDAPLVSTLHGTQATRTLWNDAAATTVNLGAGANVATMQVGVATTTVPVPGNLTVSGTVTTISSTNLVVNDPLIYANSGGAAPSFAGIAWDQGAGLDIIVVWNPTDSRVEVGRFNTVGGTVVPAAALSTLTDFRVSNLNVGGTTVTGEGGLVVQSNGQLQLHAQGANVVLLRTNSADRWRVESAGHFTAGADNTYDIGDVGAKPRTIYAATSFDVGGTSLNATDLTGASLGGFTITGSNGLLIQASGANAITLQTAGSARWQVTGPGHLTSGTGTDNTLDIGQVGSDRPRTVYVGTSVVVGSTVTIGTAAVTGSGTLTVTATAATLALAATGANPITLSTASTQRVHVGGGGLVGIGDGVTASGTRVQITEAAAGTQDALTVTRSTGTGGYGIKINMGSTVAYPAFTVVHDNTGPSGLGFQINSYSVTAYGGRFNGEYADRTATAAGVGGGILLSGNYSGGGYAQAIINAAKSNGTATNTDSDLVFSVTANPNTTTVTERWRILAAGSLAGSTATSHVSMFEGANFVVGTATGTKIGTATTQKLGFWNATPVVQQAVAALTNNVTAGGVNDTIADFTDLTVYANDAATIRNDIYQLARKLKEVVDALRLVGIYG
jgi:hypothetical protein